MADRIFQIWLGEGQTMIVSGATLDEALAAKGYKREYLFIDDVVELQRDSILKSPAHCVTISEALAVTEGAAGQASAARLMSAIRMRLRNRGTPAASVADLIAEVTPADVPDDEARSWISLVAQTFGLESPFPSCC